MGKLNEQEWFFRLGSKDFDSRVNFLEAVRRTGRLFGAAPSGSDMPAVEAYSSLDKLSLPNPPPLVLRFCTTSEPTRRRRVHVYWDRGAENTIFYENASVLKAELESAHSDLNFDFLDRKQFRYGVLSIPVLSCSAQNERRNASKTVAVDRRKQQQDYYEEVL